MKTNINLYQSSCYLEKPKATFKQLLLCLFFSSLCVIFLKLYLDNKSLALKSNLGSTIEKIVTKENSISLLSLKLAKQEVDIEKIQKALNLEKKIELHKLSLQNISFAHKNYSLLMEEIQLSKIDSITIEHFHIQNSNLDISGKGLNPNSVPLWLLNMKNKNLLSDQTFDLFELKRSDGQFSFNLKNKGAN